MTLCAAVTTHHSLINFCQLLTQQPNVFTRTNSILTELHTKLCMFYTYIYYLTSMNCGCNIFGIIGEHKMFLKLM